MLALASRRPAEAEGEEGAYDPVGILGGEEALGDLRVLLEGSRGGVLAGVGLADRPDAPRLGPGEGVSDEVEAQRDSRHY